jgi:BirA family biotin operon repressor/biotin-[acetyl-CoA-carboxylase] ligase
LAKSSWPQDVARHILPEVDSTNAHALRLAPQLSGPAWFLGLSQTAGRGRRARAWASPVGNFHATLLTFPKGRAESVALRSFAAALALRDAFVLLTGMPDSFRLKWPNDVLLNGKKVAGILLESSGAGGQVVHLAIGVGVNLIAAPDPSMLESGALPAVCLADETGITLTPDGFLDALAPAFAHWELILTTAGFGPLRNEWLAHAARLGENITARTGSSTFHGRFETIDLHGNLMLRTPHEMLSIPAADVFF